MSRTVVIDKSVIDQINYGNADMARVMRSLIAAKAEIWITAEDRGRLFRDAERRMIADLGIQSPLQDANADRYERRLNPGAAPDAVPHGSVPTAALALDKGAEVLTANRSFANTYRAVGGQVAPEGGGISALAEVKPIDLNYNAGRRLLGLRDLNIGANGQILPTPKPPKPAAATSTGGPRSQGGAQTTKKTTAQVGDPVEAPPEYGLSDQAAKREAKVQGATIAFKGVNFVLQFINDRVQAGRVNDRWTQIKGGVESKLDADPQMGAMLIVYYSRGRGDAESAIESVNIFQDMEVAYGLTREDALRRHASQPQIRAAGAGDTIVDNSTWIPPKQPVDVRQLPTPFPKAGLATFIPGKEKLTKVKFSIAFGFDDKIRSREWVDVPDGVQLRFLYLWPPDKITYFDNGYKTHEVDWDMSTDADISKGNTGAFFMGVPAVKLDSWINPGDTMAAMVWPADNVTANVFKTTRPTDDGGLLKQAGISLLRWVKPEFMQIIDDFHE